MVFGAFRQTILRSSALLLTLAILAACGAPAATSVDQPASSAQASTAASAAAASTAGTAETAETAETTAAGGEITVYSGRNEELIGQLIEQYQAETGTKVNVKYGDTAELAATILEEGTNSPADVFFAQDAGALGAVAAEDRLQKLPDAILNSVDERFRSPEGEWIGVSGRARTVVYNTKTITETDLPETIFGFTDPKWKGRLGWVPTNGSFQAFVTALRVLEGEDKAREWLEGIKANEPKVYENNSAVVQAAAAGEIDAGFVNHYYLVRQIEEQGESFGARNYYFKNGDPGSLVNVAGAGIISSSKNQEAAARFVQFLVSETAQKYFTDKTFEYPLIASVQPNSILPALGELQTPNLDLSKLNDLKGTLQLLQDLGIL
jgi:iron(III) transport system substrate-binding protein